MVFVPSKSSRSHAMMELCHVRLPLFSLAVPPRLAWPRRRTCTVVLLYHPNPLTPALSPAHPRPTKETSLYPTCFPRGIAPPPSPSKVWKRVDLHLPNTGTPQVHNTPAACMHAPIRTYRPFPKETQRANIINLPTPACAFPSLHR
jgi:hypothetical protein